MIDLYDDKSFSKRDVLIWLWISELIYGELGTELSVIPWKLESDDADEYKLSDVYDRLSESDKLGRASVNVMSGVCIRNINSLKQPKRHR